jgi:hypothetical protein
MPGTQSMSYTRPRILYLPILIQKNLIEASYVLDLEIHRDRSKGMLQLSQKTYFEGTEEDNMHKYSDTPAHIVKCDKFGIFRYPRNQTDEVSFLRFSCWKHYVKVCTHPDLDFVTEMLGIFQSNSVLYHWKAVKKVVCYMQGTKTYILIRCLVTSRLFFI